MQVAQPSAALAVAEPAWVEGIHLGVPAAEYHARELGVANKGGLDVAHRSAAHYWHWITSNVHRDSAAFAFGRALHTIVLEPALFDSTYTIEPDFGDCRANKATGTTKEQGAENKARRDAWRLANGGKQFLSEEDMTNLRGMANRVSTHPLIGQMFRGGAAEVTLRWRDAATGLRCKARADYWVRSLGLCLDLKSCEDASEKGFAKSCASYRYGSQDAHYRRGFAHLGQPLAVDGFVFVAVEKADPWELAAYYLLPDAQAKGEQAVVLDMERIADAVRTNDWKGYRQSITGLELPPWAD
jgi:hypothetical protein